MSLNWRGRPSTLQILGFRPFDIRRRSKPQPVFIGARLAAGTLIVWTGVVVWIAWWMK